MEFTRGIAGHKGGGLRVTWLLAAHWVALIVVPYLLFAAWAGALDDPDEWRTHRCWGQPHVVWLGLGNAGMLLWLGLRTALDARGGASRAYLAGAGFFGALLLVAQVALWRWVDTLRLLLPDGG